MLVDASAYFPALLRKPGITTWKPTTNRSITFFDSFEAYVESLPDDRQKRSHKMLRTHWPPSNADELQLNRWYVPFTIFLSRLENSLQHADIPSSSRHWRIFHRDYRKSSKAYSNESTIEVNFVF
jgi:hypothetical protein